MRGIIGMKLLGILRMTKNKIQHMVYDEEADVLYLLFTDLASAVYNELDSSVYVRYEKGSAVQVLILSPLRHIKDCKSQYIDYDENADVLYLRFTNVSSAVQHDEIEDGLLAGLDVGGKIVGVTILSFMRMIKDGKLRLR